MVVLGHHSVKTQGTTELYLSWAKCVVGESDPGEAVMYIVVA